MKFLNEKPKDSGFVISSSWQLDSMFNEFERTGFIILDSPKMRKKFYLLLEKNNIEFKSTIVGYTSGYKSLCRWAGKRRLGWDLGRLAKWIKHKRLLKDDLESYCTSKRNIFSYEGTYFWDFEEIKSVFDENKSKEEIKKILEDNWGNGLRLHKWTPFDNIGIKKTIVRIDKVPFTKESGCTFEQEKTMLHNVFSCSKLQQSRWILLYLLAFYNRNSCFSYCAGCEMFSTLIMFHDYSTLLQC